MRTHSLSVAQVPLRCCSSLVLGAATSKSQEAARASGCNAEVRHGHLDVTSYQILSRLSGQLLQSAAMTLGEQERTRRRPAPCGAARYHIRSWPKSPP